MLYEVPGEPRDGVLRLPLLKLALRAVDARLAVEVPLPPVGDGLDEAWAKKPDGVVWKGCTEDSAALVSMRATGG